MIKLMRSKGFCWSISSNRESRKSSGHGGGRHGSGEEGGGGEIKCERRPGGLLVQRRGNEGNEEGSIVVRVSMGYHQWHHISVKATSTFGELKEMLCMVTKLEPREQRLIFKGKEREDGDYLHMVGVGDMDKVLLLEDPALKEMKLLALENNMNSSSYWTPCHVTNEMHVNYIIKSVNQ